MANIIKFGGGGGGDNAPKAIFKRVHCTGDTANFSYAGNGGITIDFENNTFKTHSWNANTYTLENDFLSIKKGGNSSYIVTFTIAGTYSIFIRNVLKVNKKKCII